MRTLCSSVVAGSNAGKLEDVPFLVRQAPPILIGEAIQGFHKGLRLNRFLGSFQTRDHVTGTGRDRGTLQDHPYSVTDDVVLGLHPPGLRSDG